MWEWCADDWHDNYNNALIDGSTWSETENNQSDISHTLRGGAWGLDALVCRSAYRYNPKNPGNWYRMNLFGFRVVCEL